MSIKIKVDVRGPLELIKKLKKEMKEAPHGAKAGYYAGERHKDENGKEQPLISDIALWNEFGVPEKKIPPRPFLRNAKKKMNKRAHQIITAGLQDEKKLDVIMKEVAQEIRNQIVESIKSNTPPPNKPSTIRQKHGSTGTLRDTGQLMNSVHAAIVKGKTETEVPEKNS